VSGDYLVTAKNKGKLVSQHELPLEKAREMWNSFVKLTIADGLGLEVRS
jgi:hypothetical protein